MRGGAHAVEKDGDDALVVFGRSPGHGLAQLGDGAQEILGADVIANRAVGHCGLEQCRQGGAGSLQEVAREPREGRIARVQC